MNRLTIQLVTSGATALSTETFTTSDLIAAMEVRGFKANGRVGGNGLREELRDKPGFVGLAGPMWGGDGKIRYEDYASCEILSS